MRQKSTRRVSDPPSIRDYRGRATPTTEDSRGATPSTTDPEDPRTERENR